MTQRYKELLGSLMKAQNEFFKLRHDDYRRREVKINQMIKIDQMMIDEITKLNTKQIQTL